MEQVQITTETARKLLINEREQAIKAFNERLYAEEKKAYRGAAFVCGNTISQYWVEPNKDWIETGLYQVSDLTAGGKKKKESEYYNLCRNVNKDIYPNVGYSGTIPADYFTPVEFDTNKRR